MKKLGANVFLFTILMGLIFLPISSLKLAKQEAPEVLSFEDIKEEYLHQRIDEQSEEIQKLREQLELTNEVSETTQSTSSEN